MDEIILPEHIKYDSTCRTYPTSNSSAVNVSIGELFEVIKNIPERPKLFKMRTGFFRNSYLPDNYIILSDSVANALEEAIEMARKKEEKPAEPGINRQ